MNVLIVHAHENKDSFCSALGQTAKTFFENEGHHVTFSDLYAMDFDPVGGKRDFIAISEANYYKYAIEQITAHNSNTYNKPLRAEMRALEKADILLFNFPLWWFSMPAILKGWVDKVLSYGFAYGGEYGIYKEGRFKGKKAFLSITTGSPEVYYTKDGVHGRTLNDILKNINGGILELVGFDVVSPFVAYAVSRATKEERVQMLLTYGNYLQKNFT